MKRSGVLLLVAGGLVAATVAQAQISIICDGPDIWKVMTAAEGVSSELSVANEAPGNKPCQRLDFSFPKANGKFVILHATLPGVLSDEYQAVKITYAASLPKGLLAPLVMLSEREGADYFFDPFPSEKDQWQTLYLPLAKFHLGSWSKDPDGKFDPANVYEVRLAVAGEPAADQEPGALWLSALELVKEIPPDAKLPARAWMVKSQRMTQDEAKNVAEGPNGETVMRYDFAFPPDADAFGLAVTMLSGKAEIGNRTKLRLTYKTQLPAGLDKIVAMLGEQLGNAQYVAMLDPAPDWTTVDLPLSAFTLAGGAQDPDGKLDPDQVQAFGIGLAGQAQGQNLAGAIWLKSFEFAE